MRLDSEVIPIRERSSMLFLRCGRLDVENGVLVLVDETGVRMQIPLGGIACLLMEPGTVITHAAVALAADCGTLLLWVGEGGVRLYSAGQPGGARADRLLYLKGDTKGGETGKIITIPIYMLERYKF